MSIHVTNLRKVPLMYTGDVYWSEIKWNYHERELVDFEIPDGFPLDKLLVTLRALIPASWLEEPEYARNTIWEYAELMRRPRKVISDLPRDQDELNELLDMIRAFAELQTESFRTKTGDPKPKEKKRGTRFEKTTLYKLALQIKDLQDVGWDIVGLEHSYPKIHARNADKAWTLDIEKLILAYIEELRG